MRNAITLGEIEGTKTPVLLSGKSRELSVYVIGTPGTGKSTLLEYIAKQDMENGDGLCFVDPHGSSAEQILQYVPSRREQDVIYWCPSDIARPFGFNPLECDPTDAILAGRRAQSFVAALESLKEFQEVFAQGTRMKDMLLHLGHTFLANQGHSLLETADFIAVDPEDRQDKAAQFRQTFYPKLDEYNPEVREFWRLYDKLPLNDKRERSESTANKIRRFRIDPIMAGIFGQATNSIDFTKVLDESKILIVNLADIGRYDAAFIGALVVWELWQAARMGLGQKRPRPFHLLCDEFENYMTLAFPEIQKQGRKYKFDAVVAHQERSGLGEEIAGSTLSVKNRVVFSISGKDSLDLAREFRKDVPEGQTRQQQKFTLVTNILSHLESKGHEEERVINQSRRVRSEIERIFAYALADHQEDERLAARLRTEEQVYPTPQANFSQRLSRLQKQLVTTLDELLFAMMAAESEVEATALWDDNGVNEERFVAISEALYITLFTQVDRIAVSRRRDKERAALILAEPAPALHQINGNGAGDFIWHRTQRLWDWEQEARRAVFQLGLSLWKSKCYDHSGQLETTVTSSRTYSDVEGEIANTLAQLPIHTALVSVIENGRPAMYTIATIRPHMSEEEEIEAQARAERIQNYSRDNYGRDGTAVNTILRQRLQRNRVFHEDEKELPQPIPQPSLVAAPQVLSLAQIIEEEERGIILRD